MQLNQTTSWPEQPARALEAASSWPEKHKKVLEPIVFLDLFDYPLTIFEIYKYLDRTIALGELELILESLIAKQTLESVQGFYFLSGRRDTLAVRNRRYNYSCAKLKIALRFSRWFSIFPGVSGVAAVNFIGSHNLRRGSDIDFFIITAPGRLWLSRLFCASFAKLLNSRPTKNNKQDKICLSFYVSSTALDLSSLILPGGFDPYFYYWQRGILPLSGDSGLWRRFFAANGLETKELGRDNEARGDSELVANENEEQRKADIWERLAKKLQLRIMAPDLKKAMNKTVGVVVSDEVLKLYLTDRREDFALRFKNKFNAITTENN